MSPPRAIGVDAGGTKMLVGVVASPPGGADGEAGPALERVVRREWDARDRETVLDAIVEGVEAALEHAPDAAAVGVGVPALVDPATGAALASVHLDLEGVPVRDLLSHRLGRALTVDNESNAAMVAELRHGAARGASEAALLTLGTGVGGAVVAGGEIYRGSAGAAGELGHIVVEMDGPECFGACPGRGCLEAFASGSALARAGAEVARRTPESALAGVLAEHGAVTGEDVTRGAVEGDAAALEVVRRAGRALGAGITTLANALNPEIVVVGGGVADAVGGLMLPIAREVVGARVLGPARAVRIEPARFGDESGVIGAALMGLEAA